MLSLKLNRKRLGGSLTRKRKPQRTAWARGLVVTLLLGFGSTPVLANYQRGQAYFARQDYTDAASDFFQAYSSEGGATRLKAEWGLAQSLEHLGLYYSASKYYSVIVRRGASANNPFFRQAFEELGNINGTISLGQSQIVQLFHAKIDPAAVPGKARGFYFYYLGVEAFDHGKYEEARSYFARVPPGSLYSLRATFHLGVIASLSGDQSRSISYFERVLSETGHDDRYAAIREASNLNIARVHYEAKRYREAISYYAQIPRESDNWLEAIFEASWAFFLMQKHNNVLGNIHTLHSPFFINRFFPESYILQAITFLRLCRYQEVTKSLLAFRERYKPVFVDVRGMLREYQSNSRGFFKVIYDYRVGSLDKYKNAWVILDALSRTDVYKEAGDTIRFSDRELAHLSSFKSRWGGSGLMDDLQTFLSKKKGVAVADAGARLFETGTSYYAYLKELSDQTQLIKAEMLLGKVDALRAKLKVGTADKKANFIGGMQPLSVGEDLEYWPFEGEYWEDELGGYVYNIDSRCGKDEGGDKASKADKKAH